MKLTKLPNGYPDGFFFPAGTKRIRAGYLERGWCFCEDAISSLAKDNKLVLDLGKLSGNATDLQELEEECTSVRGPPISPETFRLMLAKKIFATLITDFVNVAQLYKNTYIRIMTALEKLNFQGLSWSDGEVFLLAQSCSDGSLQCLKELQLDYNDIGDSGCEALAEACTSGALPSLTLLHLGANRIGDSGCRALADASLRGALQNLEELYLFSNEIGDLGCSALATAGEYGALTNLEMLCLQGNPIGQAGRDAFQDAKAKGALPNCSLQFEG